MEFVLLSPWRSCDVLWYSCCFVLGVRVVFYGVRVALSLAFVWCFMEFVLLCPWRSSDVLWCSCCFVLGVRVVFYGVRVALSLAFE